MIGDSREHFAKKGFGIVAVEFCGAEQAVDGRSVIAACIAADEQIILAVMEIFP